MKPHFFALLLVVAVALTPAVSLADQSRLVEDATDRDPKGLDDSLRESPERPSNNSTDAAGDLADRVQCSEPEVIDSATYLCSASIDRENNVVLVFKSERMFQRIQLTDAGAFRRGGSVPTKAVDLREGITRVEWQVVEYKGYTGVGIGTSNALYSKPLKRQKSLLPGTSSSSDIGVSAVTVFLLFAVSLPICYLFIRRMTGGVHREF